MFSWGKKVNNKNVYNKTIIKNIPIGKLHRKLFFNYKSIKFYKIILPVTILITCLLTHSFQ